MASSRKRAVSAEVLLTAQGRDGKTYALVRRTNGRIAITCDGAVVPNTQGKPRSLRHQAARLLKLSGLLDQRGGERAN